MIAKLFESEILPRYSYQDIL